MSIHKDSGKLAIRHIRSIKSWMLCLKNTPFINKVLILSSGSAVGHLFTLALSPLLTRIYGPNNFGALGLFTSFLSVAGVAVTLQYETSIIAASDETEAASLAISAALLA